MIVPQQSRGGLKLPSVRAASRPSLAVVWNRFQTLGAVFGFFEVLFERLSQVVCHPDPTENGPAEVIIPLRLRGRASIFAAAATDLANLTVLANGHCFAVALKRSPGHRVAGTGHAGASIFGTATRQSSHATSRPDYSLFLLLVRPRSGCWVSL